MITINKKRKNIMNRKNYALIGGFVLLFSMAIIPSVMLFNQKPIINNYYEFNNFSYYNETIPEPIPEPEPIIDRSKPVELHNHTLNGIYDYISLNYEIGNNEIYYSMIVAGSGVAIRMIPNEWLQPYLDSLPLGMSSQFGEVIDFTSTGIWTPSYLWNWTVLIYLDNPDSNYTFLYYNRIKTDV